MEVHTNGHIIERERSIITLRMESKFTILVTIPQDTSLGELHGLFPFHLRTLGQIRFVEYEMNLLCRYDSDSHVRLLVTEHRLKMWRQLIENYTHGLISNCHFLQDIIQLTTRDTLKVLLSWRYRKSCHIQSTRRDKHLTVIFSEITIRTMLLSWEDDADIFIILSPSHDIHHRFSFILLLWQRAIKFSEQLHISLSSFSTNHESLTRIILDNRETLLFVQSNNDIQVSAQAYPFRLQR